MESDIIPDRPTLERWVRRRSAEEIRLYQDTTGGMFAEQITDSSACMALAMRLAGEFNFSLELRQMINDKMRELVENDIESGVSLDKAACQAIFLTACEAARKTDQMEMSGFGGCFPSSMDPTDLVPSDIQRVLHSCITAIKKKSLEDRPRSESMKRTFFEQIIPRLFLAVIEMMVLLQDLTGDEKTQWTEQLDELAYSFILVVGTSNYIRESLPVAPPRTPIDLINKVRSVAGAWMFTEWEELIKFIYGGTLSPWTLLLQRADLDKAFMTNNPRTVIGKLEEWIVNIEGVDLTATLSEDSAKMIREFIDV